MNTIGKTIGITELSKRISLKTKYSEKEMMTIINIVKREMINAIQNNKESISLLHLGTLKVRQRKATRRYDVHKGHIVPVDAKIGVTFKMSENLKINLNS